MNQGSTYFDLKVVMPFSKAKTETLLYPNHFEIFEINKELEMPLLCTFFKNVLAFFVKLLRKFGF